MQPCSFHECTRTHPRTVLAYAAALTSTAWHGSMAYAAHHVMLRNALRDAYHKVQLSLDSFQDSRRREGRWHVNGSCIAACGCFGICYCVEHRQPQMRAATLLGRHAANHLGAIGNSLAGMQRQHGMTIAWHTSPGTFPCR